MRTGNYSIYRTFCGASVGNYEMLLFLFLILSQFYERKLTMFTDVTGRKRVFSFSRVNGKLIRSEMLEKERNSPRDINFTL